MSEDAKGDGPIDLDAALADLDASQLAGFEMVINPDGSVTFVDFPPELLDIALALNPDDPLVCQRMADRETGDSSSAVEAAPSGASAADDD